MWPSDQEQVPLPILFRHVMAYCAEAGFSAVTIAGEPAEFKPFSPMLL